MKKIVICFLFLVSGLLLISGSAFSFSNGGCEGDCRKCHSLSGSELNDILKKLNIFHVKVLSIQLSPVKSLWEITIEDKGQKGIFYIDFSKKYLVSGALVEISSRHNKTAEKLESLQEATRIDVSKIPLNNALVMGSASASKKVIVFTDPD
jgi:thiol:disulfide interchange protein DsbC